MVDADPYRTQRAVDASVTAELAAAGFDDAQEIGRGGFGVVYRCVQTELDRTVAVKVLTADLDEENRARFFREQRAMGRLTGHPNIVTCPAGRRHRQRPPVHRDALPPAGLPAGADPHARSAATGRRAAARGEDRRRAGDRAPARHPAPRRQTREHPAHRLRRARADRLRYRAHRRRIRDRDRHRHRLAGVHRARGDRAAMPPTAASDIYGLGATLFCALTGHAAFERRSGEQLVAQFLRITTRSGSGSA